MNTKSKKIKYGKVELPEDAFNSKNIKERITIMLDQDVLDAYREKAQKQGDKYQTLINRTLRDALKKPDIEERLSAIEDQLKRFG